MTEAEPGARDAPRPRVVGTSRTAPAPHAGAEWRLAEPARGLDANLIWLPPGEGIAEHDGPGLDVLVHVLNGGGLVLHAGDATPVSAGDVVWLPGAARRGFEAGDEGMRYLTVHARQPGLSIGPRPPGSR